MVMTMGNKVSSGSGGGGFLTGCPKSQMHNPPRALWDGLALLVQPRDPQEGVLHARSQRDDEGNRAEKFLDSQGRKRRGEEGYFFLDEGLRDWEGDVVD